MHTREHFPRRFCGQLICPFAQLFILMYKVTLRDMVDVIPQGRRKSKGGNTGNPMICISCCYRMLRIPGTWSDDVCLVEQCWSCNVERPFRAWACFLCGTFLETCQSAIKKMLQLHVLFLTCMGMTRMQHGKFLRLHIVAQAVSRRHAMYAVPDGQRDRGRCGSAQRDRRQYGLCSVLLAR